CVVLGAGGAAKAVLYVLFQKKVKHITLVNRTPNRLFPVKEWFQKSFRAHLDIENWENFQNGSSDFIDSADIIINTTSLGLRGEEVSLPWGNLRKCEWVIDVVYHPGGTPLVNEAQRCGIPAFDGKTMLLYQGAESFFLFTGQKAPVSVMEEAMNQAITLKIP
ncbi:MAG: shikimate dehydrogenase, partial [Candidatus Atribacteria bacterium]|nr:shikimate dehydrogenase [Candidatus Atribacteria bacterium]